MGKRYGYGYEIWVRDRSGKVVPEGLAVTVWNETNI